MKLLTKIVIGIAIVVIVVLLFAGNYFYNYAVVPSEKDFLENDTPGTSQTTKENEATKWFNQKENRTYWHLTSTDHLKLSAIYMPSEKKSDRTVIVAHGYMGNAETMANYAKMFHDLGYNVLVPDARGHGRSEGDYIGFGWPERKDYIQWIDKILAETGQSQQIVLFGVSMGAATVMMTSGEKLPNNVKAIIEDCGYSSVEEELAYQLKDMFHLPSFPLIQVTSLITKIRAGYFFGEASAVDQLTKNTKPMLFIHGDADTFVPYNMLAKVYAATKGPKEKYVVKGAEHAKAYQADPEKYQQTVKDFLAKYVQ